MWKSRFDRNGYSDIAFDIALAPDGAAAFVTGYSTGLTGAEDYTSIAYDVATGARLWLRGYNGPGNFTDMAFGVTVSPNGTEVFVTGQSDGGPTHADCATISYDAATGANRWIARYDGPIGGIDSAGALAVSPDGTAVFVTGQSDGIGTNADYTTIAYSALVATMPVGVGESGVDESLPRAPAKSDKSRTRPGEGRTDPEVHRAPTRADS